MALLAFGEGEFSGGGKGGSKDGFVHWDGQVGDRTWLSAGLGGNIHIYTVGTVRIFLNGTIA